MLASIMLAACGASSNHGNGVTLTLYSGQHVQTTDALVASFEKSNPTISVAVRSNDEATFDAQIVAEGSRSPADVFFSENSPALEYLQQKGLLAKVNAGTLAKTTSKYNSPSGDWVGVSARVSVLIYNPRLIKKSALPTSVLQLASPRYKDKLAFAPGETDFQPIVTSVINTYGTTATKKWLNGMKANATSHLYPNNETVTNDVNRGLVAFGVIDQYYWYRLRAQLGRSNTHSKIAFFSPHDPGYVIDVSGAAVLKSSTHQAAAQKFLAFLVSAKGQEIIAHSISFEYPIASSVSTAQPETPFRDLQPSPIDVAQLGTGQRAVALLREVQLL
ncbi:MAG TPA: extracellular solute-binding protein [Acidimicrobiales bacterium]|nr:extracellular solute-binding protein [Acidimicrobiales bacterium]